jgi:hypothetical protein
MNSSEKHFGGTFCSACYLFSSLINKKENYKFSFFADDTRANACGALMEVLSLLLVLFTEFCARV